MRRSWPALFSLGFALLPLAAAGQADAPANGAPVNDARTVYAALLAKQCPARHLEWLSNGELDDLIEVNFHDALPASLQVKFDAAAKAEKLSCANVTMGLSCGNAAYLRAMDTMRLLPGFAKMVCASGLACTSAGTCARDPDHP